VEQDVSDALAFWNDVSLTSRTRAHGVMINCLRLAVEADLAAIFGEDWKLKQNGATLAQKRAEAKS
jgi:hypothetical protein